LAIAAKTGSGIPLPPEAVLANLIQVAIDADYPHIPEIHHIGLYQEGKGYISPID
jgi:hypothetical protein